MSVEITHTPLVKWPVLGKDNGTQDCYTMDTWV